jgi:class 3 adenylate cyclase
VSRDESSIDVVAAAARDESLDFAGMSSPDGAVTLLIAEVGEAAQDHAAALTRVVESHDGQVVKTEAGASMCSFPSAHAGLRSAIELQREFAVARLRIGLHSGFVMADASDFYGRNVVLAARIAAHAAPGEILVSGALREYTSTDPSFDFEARGERHFKGLLGEHPVFAVRWS